MDGEEGEGLRLSKRFSDKAGSGEVDYKVKAGTAWSHSYLNQKPWHPLSYPNQRRKWIAEQTDAQKQRRAEEVAREYAQEQDFFRQTALISKKEKEKVEMMKAVSFMYVRPPGYNAESAKAAEIDDERKRQEQNNTDQPEDGPSAVMQPESLHGRDTMREEKKKPRPKDVFGRPLPTEEEFEILKNAPRLETGVPGRVKPFGVEVRNVKCLRCGNYGHQSGDRECPLKDVIMPNEESRLKRDDPLNAIIAQIDPSEPLKWELKQKPGLSPPRGGFKPDDPNQQIVAEEIFDEYGGFLSGGNIPELLTNFSIKPKKRKSGKKRMHKRQSSDRLSSPSDADDEEKSREKNHKKKSNLSESNSSDDSDFDRHQRKSRNKHSYLSEEDEFARQQSQHKGKKGRQQHSHSFEDTNSDKQSRGKRSKQRCTHSSEDDAEMHGRKHSYSPKDSDTGRHRRRKSRQKHSYSFEDSDSDELSKGKRSKQRGTHSSEDDAKMHGRKHAYSPKVSDLDRHGRRKSRQKHSYSSEDSDSDKQRKGKRSKHAHLSEDDSDIHPRKHSYSSEYSDPGRHYSSKKSRQTHSYTSKDDFGRHHKSKRSRQRHSHLHSYEDSDPDTDRRRSKHQSRH